MRLVRQSLIFSALLGSLVACTKPFNFKTEDPEVVVVNDLPADFKIPSLVWDLVEGKTPHTGEGHGGAEHAGAEAGSAEHDSGKQEKAEAKPEEAKAEEVKGEGEGKEGGEKAKPASQPILYSSVKVYLTEKNPKVLSSPSIRIEFPRGGGQFDLSDYVRETAGSFFVGFELPEEFTTGTDFKVLFVSQARKRRLENRIFGAGCSQVLDITQKFTTMMQTEGIKANTTRQRHVTLLAGHYVFSVVKDGRIYLTQVTITDSKNKNLLCEAS